MKKSRKKIIILLLVTIITLVSISFGAYKFLGLGFQKGEVEAIDIPKWKTGQNITNSKYTEYVDVYDIVRSTNELEGAAKKYYSKYIDYIAPNGKPIRLLSMDKVTDEQLLYAYNMLSFYLESYDKIDKTVIANRMADTNTTLIIPNGADRDGKTPQAAMTLGQNLNQMEIANVGSKWYVDCDYEHRDASFEEIFHMVHDYGIGITQNPGAAPKITKIIAEAEQNALPTKEADWGKKGLWGLNSVDWLKELSKEGSLEQEYIVSVIDSFYGLWEPWKDGKGGMWGIYVAKNRAEIGQKDPMGKEALLSFLPENITQMMRIDPAFEGTFIMTYDENIPYTAKSQYLQKVWLTGKKDSGVIANKLDNILIGNAGNNTIDGGEGNDVYQFYGSSDEYEINRSKNKIIVRDKVESRDGTDTLENVEILRFTDKDIKL